MIKKKDLCLVRDGIVETNEVIKFGVGIFTHGKKSRFIIMKSSYHLLNPIKHSQRAG